jgi:hypothetical protein
MLVHLLGMERFRSELLIQMLSWTASNCKNAIVIVKKNILKQHLPYKALSDVIDQCFVHPSLFSVLLLYLARDY